MRLVRYLHFWQPNKPTLRNLNLVRVNIITSSAIAMFIAKHGYCQVTFHVDLSTRKSNFQVEFWRDWCAFGNSTFDLEIQTSSFADSPRVKIIVEMLTWMLMDKVECWTVTLKVDVQSFNDCDTKYKVEEWDVIVMFAKLIVALSSRMLWSTLIFGGDGTPYLPMVHDDKRTLAWFYSDRRELLLGIEQIDASFCLELNR